MPCENCLSRREFLARSTAAVAGVAIIATGCGDGQFGPEAVVATATKVSVQVAGIAALANVGQVVQVGPPGSYYAVKRIGPATFSAVSMICTHEGCPTLIRSNRFECDCHGSVFDNNGHVLVGPANRDLPPVAVVYDAATDTLTIG